MKFANEPLLSIVQSTLETALQNFEKEHAGESLNDLYLFVDPENRKIVVYDDVENKLTHTDFTEADFDLYFSSDERQIRKTLKIIVEKLNRNKFFDKEYISKPFSVSLIDEDFIVVEELVFIDNDRLKIDDSLLKDLDRDLDKFLKDLMKS